MELVLIMVLLVVMNYATIGAEQYMITRNDGKNIFRILFSLVIAIICVCLLGNVLFGILTIAMFFCLCVLFSDDCTCMYDYKAVMLH